MRRSLPQLLQWIYWINNVDLRGQWATVNLTGVCSAFRECATGGSYEAFRQNIIGFFFRKIFAMTFGNRSCESDLPCLAALVDPVLTAPNLADAAQAVAAQKTLLAMKFASDKFETELIETTCCATSYLCLSCGRSSIWMSRQRGSN
jgi:hypothetical protein